MTSAKQFCGRKPNGEQLDQRGITEDPSLMAEIAALSRPTTPNPNSFEISVKEGRNSLTSVFGKFHFHISIVCLSLFVASFFFCGESRSFYTQQGSRQNDNNRTQPAGPADGVRRSFRLSQLFHRPIATALGTEV